MSPVIEHSFLVWEPVRFPSSQIKDFKLVVEAPIKGEFNAKTG